MTRPFAVAVDGAVALVFDLVAHEDDRDLLGAEALGEAERERVRVDAAFGLGDARAAGGGRREVVEVAAAERAAVTNELIAEVQAHRGFGPVAAQKRDAVFVIRCDGRRLQRVAVDVGRNDRELEALADVGEGERAELVALAAAHGVVVTAVRIHGGDVEAVDAGRVVDDRIVVVVARGEDRREAGVREVRAHGRRVDVRAQTEVAVAREDVRKTSCGELAPFAAHGDEGFVEENRIPGRVLVVEFAAVGLEGRGELQTDVVAAVEVFTGAQVEGRGFVTVGHHAGARGAVGVMDLEAGVDEAVDAEAFLEGGSGEVDAGAAGEGRAGESHGDGGKGAAGAENGVHDGLILVCWLGRKNEGAPAFAGGLSLVGRFCDKTKIRECCGPCLL